MEYLVEIAKTLKIKTQTNKTTKQQQQQQQQQQENKSLYCCWESDYFI